MQQNVKQPDCRAAGSAAYWPGGHLNVEQYVSELGANARKAAVLLARIDTGAKNKALLEIAHAIEASQASIIAENSKDVEAGKRNGLSVALLDRLELTPERVSCMAEGLRQVAALPDPVGEISGLRYRPSGIQVGKMRVPLGVIGIIYESRPNVTADAAALCLKSGNATLLRGGSEAIHSNLAIARCIETGLQAAGLPKQAVQVIATTDRAVVKSMISSPEYVDIIIPRGGKNLIASINENATVPVIKHLEGLCHVYIDDKADLKKAHNVAYNAKTRRYGICGAMETLLIADAVAKDVLPGLAKAYVEKGVELRGCKKSRALVKDMLDATEEDWFTEYLGPILSVRVVDGLEQAIEHINHYGSQHTDSIITEDISRSRRFLAEVDSSSVMVNVSTQFADGFEYGLGAEIGISTGKLHVRGPVGLEGLTCQKYIVLGDGHTRA